MIKITRIAKPAQLTRSLQNSLTAEFKSTGKNVWNVPFIKDALLAMSGNKCCYCETNIIEESKYMEVEHFHHKGKYQDEVLEWSNLLPSCKKCNCTKKDHDTILEPIIDPSVNDPKAHLLFWNYRIKAIDDLGKMTISVLDLNNQDRLVKKRLEIGDAIHAQFESLNEITDDYISGIQTSTMRRNDIVKKLKALLRQGLPGAIYAATAASITLNDTEYKALKKKLSNAGLWDADMADLETQLGTIALKLAI